jgi:Calpain family cysteine protease
MKKRLLFLFIAVSLPTTGAAQSKNPTFRDIVAADFQRWDANKDGKLTPEEIDVLVVDPKITGNEAAAVASIHHYFFLRSRDEDRKSVVLHKKDLLSHEGAKFKHHDGTPDVYDFDNRFHVAIDRIRTASRKLFVGDAPRLEGIHQTSVGDCYLISIIGACVHTDAAKVKQSFRPHKDGSCEVVFGSGQRVVVPKLTDAQIAQGTSAHDQGLWLTVLEEAYGQIRFADETKPRRPGDIALDSIARGGTMLTAIHVLTGHRTDLINLKRAKDPDATLQRVREALRTAIAGKLLMSCDTRAADPRIPGLGGNHAYGILSFDEKHDKVVVWNPWGNEFAPAKQPPGLTNGYPTKGGRFEVPLREFVQGFFTVVCETNLPAKQVEAEKDKK